MCQTWTRESRWRGMVVPSVWHLFEPIEGLVGAAHVVGSRGVNEARWLLAVHGLSKCAMQRSIFDVQLMDGPVDTDREGEDGADGGQLDDGAEYLVVVKARLLRETLHISS